MILIDAYKLCEYANNLKDKTVDANDIMRFPRVDAVEVVRCKDCENYMNDDNELMSFCGVTDGLWRPDDYCSYGRRRG